MSTEQGLTPWRLAEIERLMAFVVLPHCMQTSANFWGRVGFQLGQKVDAKESKQATLSSPQALRHDSSRWKLARVSMPGVGGGNGARREAAHNR